MSRTTTTTCDRCGKVTRNVNLTAEGQNWDVSIHGSDPFIDRPSGRTSRMRFASWDFCHEHAQEVHAFLVSYATPGLDDTDLASPDTSDD